MWGRRFRLPTLDSRPRLAGGYPLGPPAHNLFTDHGDTALGDGVPARPVGIRIEPDGVQFGNLHSGFDNLPADADIAADFHPGHQNRILHFTITVHAHAGREHTVYHPATRNDTSGAHDGIERQPHPAALLGENELGRRLLRSLRADGPVLVVKVKFRSHRHQVHVGLVIGVERAYVPPVARLFGVDVAEI